MTSLVGQDSQVAAFRDAAASGKLHHAWLLTGPKGVGKGMFARAAAQWLLAEAAGPKPEGPGFEVAETHPIAKLIAAGSHPDYRALERLPRETGGELARNIPIAQVRGLQSLFVTTPSLSSRRVVVIDAIDDLERSAANALLKNLEEPPTDAVFLLISHAPGRLLPTIRSRCRLLRFQPLDDAAMTSVLRQALPEAEPAEIDALVSIGGGAPGAALRFAGLDVAAIESVMSDIALTGDPGNAARSALAKSLATKAAQARYELFLERAPAFIADLARKRSGMALADALTRWEEARKLAGSAVHLSLEPQSVVFELGGLIAGLAPKSARAKG